MSNSEDFGENVSRRSAAGPYTHRHPVPNIQDYQDRLEEREADAEATRPQLLPDEVAQHHPEESKLEGIIDTVKSHLHLNGSPTQQASTQDRPYSSTNRNVERPASQGDGPYHDNHSNAEEKDQTSSPKQEQGSGLKDTSESTMSEMDPRKKRKNMKKMKRDHAPREVTDPVTHLPVIIHDSTNKELKSAPENVPEGGGDSPSSGTGSKDEYLLKRETQQEQAAHSGMEKLFPPPQFQAAEKEMTKVYDLAMMIGLGSVLASVLLVLVGSHLVGLSSNPRIDDKPSRSRGYFLLSSLTLLVSGLGVGYGLIWGLRGWLRNKIKGIWEDELWDAAKSQEQDSSDSPTPESTEWLNSLLGSVWSLINPDLFTNLADTLEDVMQASLPKMVRMISVEDLGQGSEALRILGIRWLPTGAAAKAVSVDGKIKSGKEKEQSDRKVPNEGDVDDDKSDDKGERNDDNENEKQQEGDDENVAEGLEAEEGDFVNVEVAFSYRASRSGKSLRVKAKNAHLYLAFYLPGKIRFRKLAQMLALNTSQPLFNADDDQRYG